MNGLDPKLFADKKRDLSKLKKKSITPFPSRKLGFTFLTESPLEAEFCYQLEWNADVVSYEAQPLGIRYFLNGSEHIYTPDFLVEFATRQQYYEVKKEEDLAKEKGFAEHFEACQRACSRLGRELVLVTDATIEAQPIKSNLRALFHLPDIKVPDLFVLGVKHRLKSLGSATIEQLADGYPRPDALAFCHRLIADGVLVANLHEEELGLSATVKLGGEQ